MCMYPYVFVCLAVQASKKAKRPTWTAGLLCSRHLCSGSWPTLDVVQRVFLLDSFISSFGNVYADNDSNRNLMIKRGFSLIVFYLEGTLMRLLHTYFI